MAAQGAMPIYFHLTMRYPAESIPSNSGCT